METKLYYLNNLKSELATLTVFRNFLETEVGINLLHFLDSAPEESTPKALHAYSGFVRSVYESGGDLGIFIRDFIRSGDDLWVKCISQDKFTEEIKFSIERELAILHKISSLKPDDLIPLINYESELSRWKNTSFDANKEFLDLMHGVSTKGYGIFRNNMMFKVKDGELYPIPNADYQTLNRLYGYERERELVLKNTEALARGETANNALLYGDAGTGKSTTVKACAAHYVDQGIRLIEFGKKQVDEIPVIAEKLTSSPLKFIFFIDDLTFNEDDDNFYALKGILEGNAGGTGNNILIYATSNRRHLIKESASARQGDDLHLNDTLQETMSLSSRFGLTVTFMKPEKDLYLSIVESLANEYGISVDDDLMTKAEAFAIRANGRSPRTAKQFIILTKTGLR